VRRKHGVQLVDGDALSHGHLDDGVVVERGGRRAVLIAEREEAALRDPGKGLALAPQC